MLKKCPCCNRELPLTEFYKLKRGGYYAYCRECATQKNRDFRYKLAVGYNLNGGYKIYILDYVKKREFKYNIVSTEKGLIFQTNDKITFIKYLEGL